MGGELELDPLISHRVWLDDGPAMFSAIRDRTEWVNKAMFVNPDVDAAPKGPRKGTSS
jgi:hypothetical protein